MAIPRYLSSIAILTVLASACGNEYSAKPAPVNRPSLLDVREVLAGFPEEKKRFSNLCVMAVEIQRRRKGTSEVLDVAPSDSHSMPGDDAVFVTYLDSNGQPQKEYYYEKRTGKMYSKAMKAR